MSVSQTFLAILRNKMPNKSLQSYFRLNMSNSATLARVMSKFKIQLRIDT